MTRLSSKASLGIRRSPYQRPGKWRVGLAIVGVLAATAVVNHRLAKRAEQRNPPVGRFIDVKGVRLHYLERGEDRRWFCFMAMAA